MKNVKEKEKMIKFNSLQRFASTETILDNMLEEELTRERKDDT